MVTPPSPPRYRTTTTNNMIYTTQYVVMPKLSTAGAQVRVVVLGVPGKSDHWLAARAVYTMSPK